MTRYKLLGFDAVKRGGGFLPLSLLLLAAAGVDRFYRPFLADYALVVWVLGGVFLLLFILAQLQSTTAYLLIEPDELVIQFRRHELRVPYADIDVVTGGRLSQHYSLKEFNGRTRRALKPYFNQTHIFVTLYKHTDALTDAKNKFPPFLFGSTQLGLLLITADEWITVERAIDAANTAWRNRDKAARQEDTRTFTAKIWEEYADDDDEDNDNWLAGA
jgi:hypothetical protein